jgi:polysaccharide biosynthesis transport protein
VSKSFELLSKLGKYDTLFQPQPPPLQPQPPPQAAQPAVKTAHISSPSLSWTRDEAPSEEEIKLVQRVFVVPGQDAPKSVAFCGVDEEDESKCICARVGEILAARGAGRVCLIDASLHAPSLQSRYGMDGHVGIRDASRDAGAAANLARQIGVGNLWLLTAESGGTGPQAVLSMERFRDLISQLREQFSTILVAAPPVNHSAATMVLGQFVDGVILVLKANSTHRAAAVKAKENLQASSVRLLGAILADRTYPVPEGLYRRL